jgi:cysteine desulfurase
MIYADYNATTPCLPEIADLMQRILLGDFGNPSHLASTFGRKARGYLDTAREQVARAVGAHTDEIIFTSGATEAANMAVIGVMQRLLGSRPRILTGATEHPAVCMPAEFCGGAGAEWLELPVDTEGRLNLEVLRREVDGRTALVCVMGANNETGVLQDIPAIARICHEHGALLFCDLTQALGKIPFSVHDWEIDLACFSAHKCYGPKGAGALFKRRGLAISPLIHGGGQENGLRSGTENVPAIAGFGLAADLATRDLSARRAHLGGLTRLLEETVRRELPGVLVQGGGTERMPGTSMFSHPGLRGNWLPQLSDVVATAGSACASAQDKPSPVLIAMGNSPGIAARSVRISFGMPSNGTEVRHIAHRLVAGARRLLD